MEVSLQALNQVLGGGDPPYRRQIPLLAGALNEAQHGKTYQGAEKICLADRELWMWYFNFWLDYPEKAETDAKKLAKMMESALAKLEEILKDAVMSVGEREHVQAMVVNTQERKRMFEVLGDKALDYDEKRAAIKSRYDSLIASQESK